MARTTSVYLSDELDAAVRASGRTVPELVRLGLENERNRDRLADQVERLTDALARGYRLVPP